MKATSSIPYAVTLLLMGTTLAGAFLTDRQGVTPLGRPLAQIAPELSGWTQVADAPLDSAVLEQLKPTTYLSRVYGKAEQRLGLLVIYYAQQRAGESMHSPEHCLPGAGWQIQRRDIDALPLDGRAVNVNRYHIAHSGENYVMYYWYQSKRRVISAEYLGKALLAWDAVANGRTEGSLVRIMFPDTPAAERGSRGFATAVLGEMQKCF